MVKILFLNTNGGLPRKVTRIRAWCEVHRVEIAAVAETWLCDASCQGRHKFKCQRMNAKKGWNWVGRSRKGRTGGGVGILIKDTVAYSVRDDLNTDGVEDFWIELDSPREGKCLLCVVYIPPVSIPQVAKFQEATKKILQTHRRVMIVGDFNGRSSSFGDRKENNQGEAVVDFINSCDLFLENIDGVVTRKKSESVLDLVLSSPDASQRITGWRTHDEFRSDHMGISFDFRFAPKADLQKPRVAWNFRRVNWETFKTTLERALSRWEAEIDPGGPPDELYISWIECILEVARSVIPKKKVSAASKPAVSEKLGKLSRLRKRAIRMKNRRDTPMLRERIRSYTIEIQSELELAKIRSVERLLEFPVNATYDDLWERFKKITRAVSKVGTVLQQGGRSIYTNEDKVREFNDFFANRGAEGKEDNFCEKHREGETLLVEKHRQRDNAHIELAENLPLSIEEVRGQVKNLKAHKSMGVDGIHPNFLIQGGEAVIRTLTYILNVSWGKGRLFHLWKLAEIVPIPKNSSASQISDFRPISLLSVVCKVMEGVLTERLMKRAEQERWFPTFSGGFRPGRGTTDQLLAFSHRVSDSMKRGWVCATAFLDVSAAYDRCFREGLIAKLVRLGVRGRMLWWLMSFLTNREARVRFNGERSRFTEHKFGLPQGSRLSPVLFNVFMADILPRNFLTQDTDAGVYADDVRISAFGRTAQEAAKTLSNKLEEVATWARKNRVKFDVLSKKCGYMLFSRNHQRDCTVNFGTQQLTRISTTYKYLGVLFKENLSFADHVRRIKGKAWRALHDVKRVVGDKWGATLPVVLKLYSALVRPVLEYACAVWDCADATTKKQLDGIQRAALLAATGAAHTTSTAALEVYCNLQSLQLRRDFISATTLQRIRRLDSTHPVAQVYRAWIEKGRPFSRASLFPRAFALCSSFYRSAGCVQAPVEFIEVLDHLRRGTRSRASNMPRLSKESAKCEHLKLSASIENDDDILRIYTDGSAIPNPGRIGSGVCCVAPNLQRTISEPLGFGSNISAELCAMRSALREAPADKLPIAAV